MAVSLVTEPVKTPESIQCNVNAARAQLPYAFLSTTPDEDNYKVNIDILDDADNPLFDITFRFAVKPDGSLFVDVGQALTELHERNGQSSILFKLEFWETFTGTTGTKTKTAVIQSIYAFRGFAQKGGSNMYLNLADTTTLGNSLTLFTDPCMWVSNNTAWRRTVNFLIDEDLAIRVGAEVELKASYRDANGDYIKDANVEDLTTGKDPGVVTATIGVVDTAVGSTSRFLLAEFVTIGGGLPVYNPITFKVEQACSSPILIEWLNQYGGWDQYVFDYSQDIQLLTEAGVRAEKGIVQDLEVVTETKIRVADDWTQSILLQADNLSLETLYALNDIKKSSSVRVLLDRNGNKFIRVVVSNTFETTYNTNNAKHEFAMQIEFPNNVNVYDLIDYESAALGAHQDVAFTEGFN